ncbi:MAG: hypothetical protein ICV85_15615 [Tolypothrix sp. T3-bin4]|nr:hypothetical protein [Tolypothrix sp. T3-bin4]
MDFPPLGEKVEGMGNGAWGIGHWALGRQCVGRVSRLEATAVMGHGDWKKNYYLLPITNFQCPLPNAQWVFFTLNL